MKVLIVDDNYLAREMMTKLLLDWGYEVVSAEDGRQAWEMFCSEDIRFIITDIMMPSIDGIELCQRVRGSSKNHYTYMIVVTGSTDDKSLFEALFAGADDFIMKPWSNSEVRARLRTGERILHLESELNDRIHKLEAANQLICKSNDRIRQEIVVMSKIQNTLLPTPFEEIDTIKIDWKNQPCSQLAGDGFNIFRIDESSVAMYMLDVAGTGPAASFMLASLSRKLVPIPGQPGILKSLAMEEPGYIITEPNEVLKNLNTTFPMDVNTNQYFTILYAIYNYKTGEFKYSTAGHPVPFVVNRAGDCIKLDGTGCPIGIFEDSQFDMWTIKLEAGDRIYMCSDGICDVSNTTLQTFGSNKMADVLIKTRGRKLSESIEILFQEGIKWSKHNRYVDDISIFSLEIGSVYGA